VDYESHAVALDRNELGALLVTAGLGTPGEHALISLLALNGLRVSEATGADIEHLGLERGRRTLTITRKGGKIVTIPLAPRTARAIDLAIGEHTEGPVFLAGDGRRLDRHGAGRIVRKTARRAGLAKTVTPHTLRHAFITAAQGRGVASDATFRLRRRAGSVRAAALRASGLACWLGAGHAAGAGVLAAGCAGWQDVASRSVALGDRLMRSAHGRTGAGLGARRGSLALVAADGSAPVSPGAALLEEMLAGWRRQQQARRLTVRLIAAFTGCWPWQWSAAQAEAWVASGGWAHSTVRSYEGALALFLEYVCDPRYG
jgi:Phage integrase family